MAFLGKMLKIFKKYFLAIFRAFLGVKKRVSNTRKGFAKQVLNNINFDLGKPLLVLQKINFRVVMRSRKPLCLLGFVIKGDP